MPLFLNARKLDFAELDKLNNTIRAPHSLLIHLDCIMINLMTIIRPRNSFVCDFSHFHTSREYIKSYIFEKGGVAVFGNDNVAHY
jgi:hypothetical protein